MLSRQSCLIHDDKRPQIVIAVPELVNLKKVIDAFLKRFLPVSLGYFYEGGIFLILRIFS